MRAKHDVRKRVEDMRRSGLSYREILQRVPVSKSSVSLWCRTIELDRSQEEALKQRKVTAGQLGLSRVEELRQSGQLKRKASPSPIDDPGEVAEIRRLYRDERFSFREVAERLGMKPWHVYGLMVRNGIPRRRGAEQNYATYKSKPQFSLKQNLTQEEEQLRVAGTMLYMAEGTKRGSGIDFTNSDPRLITLFLAFLRQVCGVSESRLRARMYAYTDQNLEHLYRFWSKLTRIPRTQFTKPYVRPLTPNVSRRKMSKGLLHVQYSDTRLLRLIGQWGEEISKSLGQVPERPKGPHCK